MLQRSIEECVSTKLVTLGIHGKRCEFIAWWRSESQTFYSNFPLVRVRREKERVVGLRLWMWAPQCLFGLTAELQPDSPQVNWRICSHKDVSPIICKAVVNDSSCEAGMHHFQADLSLTSHSRVLLIQIYIWQDTLWAYIKWIRTPLGHPESIAKWKRRH